MQQSLNSQGNPFVAVEDHRPGTPVADEKDN